MQITRILTVGSVNGQGNRARAIYDAMDQLNIAVRAGGVQMTMEAMAAAQNVGPAVFVTMANEDGAGIGLPLSTWEEVETFKTVPGVWADGIGQWAHEHYRPAGHLRGKLPDDWRQIKVTFTLPDAE